MSTAACSFGTVMVIALGLSLVNVIAPLWTWMHIAPSVRVGSGVWEVGFAATNTSSINFDKEYASFLAAPCSFNSCDIPPQSLHWESVASLYDVCNTSSLVYLYWSNQYCDGEIFVIPGEIYAGRALCLLTLIFIFAGVIGSCVSACTDIETLQVAGAVLGFFSALVATIFIVAEYGSFITYTYSKKLSTSGNSTTNATYVPFINVDNELVVIPLHMTLGPAIGAAFIVSCLTFIGTIGLFTLSVVLRRRQIDEIKRQNELKKETYINETYEKDEEDGQAAKNTESLEDAPNEIGKSDTRRGSEQIEIMDFLQERPKMSERIDIIDFLHEPKAPKVDIIDFLREPKVSQKKMKILDSLQETSSEEMEFEWVKDEKAVTLEQAP